MLTILNDKVTNQYHYIFINVIPNLFHFVLAGNKYIVK